MSAREMVTAKQIAVMAGQLPNQWFVVYRIKHDAQFPKPLHAKNGKAHLWDKQAIVDYLEAVKDRPKDTKGRRVRDERLTPQIDNAMAREFLTRPRNTNFVRS